MAWEGKQIRRQYEMATGYELGKLYGKKQIVRLSNLTVKLACSLALSHRGWRTMANLGKHIAYIIRVGLRGDNPEIMI